MEQIRKNPFEIDPERVLEERKKHARKITREEFLHPKKREEEKLSGKKK
jgi:hypothetical protein